MVAGPEFFCMMLSTAAQKFHFRTCTTDIQYRSVNWSNRNDKALTTYMVTQTNVCSKQKKRFSPVLQSIKGIYMWPVKCLMFNMQAM